MSSAKKKNKKFPRHHFPFSIYRVGKINLTLPFECKFILMFGWADRLWVVDITCEV